MRKYINSTPHELFSFCVANKLDEVNIELEVMRLYTNIALPQVLKPRKSLFRDHIWIYCCFRVLFEWHHTKLLSHEVDIRDTAFQLLKETNTMGTLLSQCQKTLILNDRHKWASFCGMLMECESDHEFDGVIHFHHNGGYVFDHEIRGISKLNFHNLNTILECRASSNILKSKEWLNLLHWYNDDLVLPILEEYYE